MSVPSDRVRRRTPVNFVDEGATLPHDTAPGLDTPAVRAEYQRRAVERQEYRNSLRGRVEQFGQDLVDEVPRALQALPGAGSAVARSGMMLRGIGAATAPLATGSTAAGNLAAGSTLAAAVPSAAVLARNEALASDTRGDVATSGSPGPRQRYRSKSGITQAPPGTENTFTGANGVTRRVQGNAATPATPEAPVERVAALGANDAERFQLRGRQGGIIRNPDAMSTADRLRMIATDSAFKGSPSMRRLAAEAVLAEDTREEANFQGAQQENAAADLAQAQGQAKAREAFADRRLGADVANVENSERRREKDRDYQLGRADRFLKAEEIGARRRLAEAQLGAQANKRTDDLVTAEMARDPTLTREQAIVRANALATLEGEDTQGSATGRAGDALAANALDAAVQRRVPTNPISRVIDALSRGAMNLYGSDLSAADDQIQRGATSPDAYDARGLNWRERVQAWRLPGIGADDVVLTDRNGRSTLVSREALGGLTPEEYNRRALLRRSTME